MLETPCMGGRKSRDGLCPATSCIKIAGVFGECHTPLAGHAGDAVHGRAQGPGRPLPRHFVHQDRGRL
ncbi:Uncharacterized protein OBRU01_16951, partial [Operophtera brumata]